MLHALIMAGGSGTRFWPASRDRAPKQLLRLVGDRTMLQATLQRLEGLVTPDNTLIMTNEKLVNAVRMQMPELPQSSVLGEPCKRDTAPCIGLAAALMMRNDPDAIMMVLPSDHVIESREQFQAALKLGERLIQANPSRFITFGIRPTYPAESFGYIERGDPIAVQGDAPRAYAVKQFREKPKLETAVQYVAKGTFYWNGGIFMWRAATLLSALRQYEPEMAKLIDEIAAAEDGHFAQVFPEKFAEIKGKSIDYAVMEHYKDVVVIEAPFTWDDVGSWQAIARLHPHDEQDNIVRGLHVGIDTKQSIIQSNDDHLIVTIGVEDLIIVHTPEATLVAPKHAEERVREAVQALKARGLEAYL